MRCASSFCPTATADLPATVLPLYSSSCLGNGGGGATGGGGGKISTSVRSQAAPSTIQVAPPSTAAGSGGGVTTAPVVGVNTPSGSGVTALATTSSRAGADTKFTLTAGGLI